MSPAKVISWLEARARRDEDTGCLLWIRAVNNEGLPVATVDGVRARNVRRWLLEQLGDPVAPGMRVVPKCRASNCVEPSHLRQLLPGQVNTLIAAEGRFKTPARFAAAQKGGRAASGRTPEDARRVRQLRAEGKTLVEISKVAGMSISNVSRICLGKTWKATAPTASVFSWAGR
jgi:hypothetical protein